MERTKLLHSLWWVVSAGCARYSRAERERFAEGFLSGTAVQAASGVDAVTGRWR